MGNRRVALISTTDEEDEAPLKQHSSSLEEKSMRKRKRKKIRLLEEEEEGDEEEERENDKNNDADEEKGRRNRKKNDREKETELSPQSGDAAEEKEPVQEDAKPIGKSIRLSGKGRGRRTHYEAFEYDGIRYDLEDPVLLSPGDTGQKPFVAIIKDITKNKDGSMMITGQWFYRPEEADLKGIRRLKSYDTRELFYSFHRDEIPAESVMHKCIVHFVPQHKQLPSRKQHPGFIVQKVYDTVERKLFMLADKEYDVSDQYEIDVLVQKTMSRLGDLLDIETEDTADQEAKSFDEKKTSPPDTLREEETATCSDQNLKAETPGSCTGNASEYYCILESFKALTGETHRDKWLEKLLQGVQYMCNPADHMHGGDKGVRTPDDINTEKDDKHPEEMANGSDEKSQKSFKSFLWPDAAIPALSALEKVSNDVFSEFQKYNKKMRQLVFNLRNPLLARRLLNGELEPSKILNMSPSELKDGFTAEETAKKEPDESEQMQMTDARCSICAEHKVGVRDIKAGHGERYKLECIGCGHSWCASRDEVSSLTIDADPSAKNVGTAPWATVKFEDVEKKVVSPGGAKKSADPDLLEKPTAEEKLG